jgi:hypothetical protein
MDKELNDLITRFGKWENIEAIGDQKEASFNLDFSKEEKGLIKLSSGNEDVSFKLKELNTLYNENIKDDSHEHVLPLLMAIETAIRNFDLNQEKITDARVINILEKLSMKPEMESSDTLMTLISLQIRLQLSLGDYSRANVRHAFRKISKSASLHNESGTRGYLDFIHKVLPATK